MADHIGLTPASFIDKQRPRGPAPEKFANVIFIDTEFTTLDLAKSPWLLSIGIVTGDGREFYAEIDTSIDKAYRQRCTDWVRGHVLTQFRKLPGRTLSPARLAIEVAEWLEDLGKEGPILACYDYSWDFDFLESALEKAGDVTCNIVPMHIGYLSEDEDGIEASDKSLAQSKGGDVSLRDHHALADARALRAQFEAVHPQEQTEPDASRKGAAP
jgi:DNA polymerase III epsilon subunit-like protein